MATSYDITLSAGTDFYHRFSVTGSGGGVFDLSNYLTSLLFLSYVALLLYQIKIFNLNQPLSCLRAFKLNNLNGIAMFLLIVTITL